MRKFTRYDRTSVRVEPAFHNNRLANDRCWRAKRTFAILSMSAMYLPMSDAAGFWPI